MRIDYLNGIINGRYERFDKNEHLVMRANYVND